MEPVRVAAVGLGWWSGVLAEAIPKGTNLHLVACTTRSADKRAAFAKKYGCREAESYEGNISARTGLGLKPDSWRANPLESPAGAMTGLGIHHVDTFHYLLGPIARVMAFSRRQVLQGLPIHDTTAILFEFASGILGYLGTAWAVANRTNYLALHGTEAQAFSEGEGSRLFLRKRGEPDRVAVPLTPVDAVVEELAEFARCIRNGGRPEVGGEQATANVAVLEAIVESGETGRAVTVTDRVRE